MIFSPKVVAIGLIFLGLSALARVYHLEADPPPRIVEGYAEHTHFRDEPAKAHEARNKAIFGRWKLNEADEYGFWRPQSPVWVYGQYLWFRLFEVSYASARAYVILYAMAGIALLFALATVHYGVLTAAFATALLSFNFAYLQYTRLALMEAVVIFYLLASTCALAAAWRRPGRAWILVPVGGLLFLAACLTKPTGLVFAPLVAAGGVYVVYRRVPHGESLRGRLGQCVGSREGVAVLGTLGILILALAALFADPEYSQRFSFQIREHFTRSEPITFLQAVRIGLLESLAGPKVHAMFQYLAPVGLGLATAEILRALLWIRQDARRRAGAPAGHPAPAVRSASPDAHRPGLAAPVDPVAMYMIGWLVLALGANLATRDHLVHFQLIMLPPIALLGGLFAARVWHAARIGLSALPGRRGDETARWLALIRAGGLCGIVILAAAGFVLYHGQRYYAWATNPTFTFPESSRALRRIIGEREAVVVGEYAAQATLETRYRHFYIRPQLFNWSEKTLLALGITHLVAHEDDMVTEVIRRNAPSLLNGIRTIGKLEFYGLPLKVYELHGVSPPRPDGPPLAQDDAEDIRSRRTSASGSSFVRSWIAPRRGR